MSKTRERKAEPASTNGAADGPVKVVPLYRFDPTKTTPWGDQYAAGTLDEGKKTFPGVPIEVKTQEFADNLFEHRLAAPFDTMTLGALHEKFHDLFGNRQRWSQPLEEDG